MFDVSSGELSLSPRLTRSVDDGSMSRDKREASIQKLNTSTSVRVALISFKAGSTGKLAIDVAYTRTN